MSLVLAAGVGCLLGAAYIGHLWHAVRGIVRVDGRSLRTGTLLRVTGLAVGFLFVGRTGSSNLIAALLGLLVTRTLLIWRVGTVSRA